MNKIKTKIIDRFIEEYSFLSNFYPSTIVVENKFYKTVEHAYQALKSEDNDVREIIRLAETPGKAKRLGRCVALRDGWDDMRENVMYDLLQKKFDNPFLSEKLLHTENAELVEGNNWNDTFFGVCRGVGQNILGKLLMKVRSELRENNHE